jgi:phosphatidylglycerophosphate synthase
MLDNLSRHRITPDSITITTAIVHIGIAWLIAMHQFAWAGLLLLIFGLGDTLDGELARLQNRASARGMLLDASLDRFKEVLIYTGAGYALAVGPRPAWAAIAVAACGTSLCVSYVKAKGEAAVAAASPKVPLARLNKLFADGLATFEVRVVLVAVGLFINQLGAALVVITILAGLTALGRLYRISRTLTYA